MEGLNLIMKVTDTISFLFILLIAIAAPLVDAQVIFPACFFPEFLTDFGKWYAGEFGNYLVAEKPNFFIGIAWIQLVVNWPISIASLYAFFAKKPWFSSTCLALGFSFLTAMGAMLVELFGSGRAPERVLILYLTFLAFDFFTILRGLLPLFSKINRANGEENSAFNEKKRS